METKDSTGSGHGAHGGRRRPRIALPLSAFFLAIVLLVPRTAPPHAATAHAPVTAQRSVATRERIPVAPQFGGVQVNEPDHDRWAAALVAAGLDAVQVTLYARQQAWDSAQLFWDRESPWVVSEIRAAKRAGLRVTLVMRTALEQGLEVNRHLWHGMIWPRDDAVDDWFERYGEFVMQGARLAAREGVELFAVGNELTSMTSTLPRRTIPDLYAYWLDPARVAPVHDALVGCAADVLRDGNGQDLVHLDGGRYESLQALLWAEEAARRTWTLEVLGGDPLDLAPLRRRAAHHERAWRALIDRVRSVYDGPVTYGANFDQVADVGFWDALDAAGVNAYFPLGWYGLDGGDRDERLRASWRRIAGELARATAPELPLLLLELGWTRKSGSTVRPYSYARVEVLETAPDGRLTCVHWATQPEDPGERVAAIRALAETVRDGDFPALRGLHLWKLTTDPAHRAIEPFALVIPSPGSGTASEATDAAHADALFLQLAADVARVVQGRD